MTIERAAEVILKSRFMGYLSREAIGLHRKRETVEWQQAMHAAQALSDAGLLAGGWRPIVTHDGSEEYVLIAEPDGCVSEARLLDDGRGWWARNNDPTDHWGEERFPTHFQPLPLPPAEV